MEDPIRTPICLHERVEAHSKRVGKERKAYKLLDKLCDEYGEFCPEELKEELSSVQKSLQEVNAKILYLEDDKIKELSDRLYNKVEEAKQCYESDCITKILDEIDVIALEIRLMCQENNADPEFYTKIVQELY